jgi:hypothetical protein
MFVFVEKIKVAMCSAMPELNATAVRYFEIKNDERTATVV